MRTSSLQLCAYRWEKILQHDLCRCKGHAGISLPVPACCVPGRAVEDVAEGSKTNFLPSLFLQKGNNARNYLDRRIVAPLIGVFPRWNHSRDWRYYPKRRPGFGSRHSSRAAAVWSDIVNTTPYQGAGIQIFCCTAAQTFGARPFLAAAMCIPSIQTFELSTYGRFATAPPVVQSALIPRPAAEGETGFRNTGA